LPAAKTAQDDLVAVLEYGAGFAVGEGDGLFAATCELDQAAGGFFGFVGDGAGGKQVAGEQVAAIAGVVGDELGGGPPELAEVGLAEAVWGLVGGAHGWGQQVGFDRQVDGAGVLGVWITGVQEIGERGGIVRWAEMGRDTERGECGRRDDPGRDAGGEAFAEERAKRLVFPGLNVASGPVVEE
jgi:hypothetical protein